MTATSVQFDPLDPAVLADPYPVYRALRENDPVHWHDDLGAWMLTRHADCTAVLRDATGFAADFRHVGIPTPGPLLSLQTLDPPEQTPLRHVAIDALRAQDYDALERDAAIRAAALLDGLAGRSTIDLVADFALPFSLGTITRLVGMPPPETDDEWRARNDALHRSMDAGLDPSSAEAGLESRRYFSEYVGRFLATGPTEGVAGYLARMAGDVDYADEVIHNSLRAFWHAGFEVPTRFLGEATLALAADPVARAGLLREPETAVDELVRFAGPVHVVSRVATADTEIGGRAVLRGDMVVVLLAAANRDPARFDDPERLDTGRTPNPHLGFGRGAHSCLGQVAARIAGRVALTALLERFPHLEPAGGARRHVNATLHGHEVLPVRLYGHQA